MTRVPGMPWKWTSSARRRPPCMSYTSKSIRSTRAETAITDAVLDEDQVDLHAAQNLVNVVADRPSETSSGTAGPMMPERTVPSARFSSSSCVSRLRPGTNQ